MAFKLSKRSLDRLNGVHDDLVAIVKEAITLTQHDFGVTCGVRTLKEQKDLVQRGLSQTMKSRHLTGHAVDLVGYHKGKVTWDWPAYFLIADAMFKAAEELDTPLRWGGAWHCNDVTQVNMDAESLCADYVAHKKAQGGKPFLDGPHFELPADRYPV